MDNEAHAKNLDWDSEDADSTRIQPSKHSSPPKQEYGDSTDRNRRELSVLGQSLVFKGELEAEEDLMVDGRVEGLITHRAQHLTIGPHGDVRADINANRVLVQGRVTGNIRATEAIVIEPSAHVAGNLFAPRIGLKEGAEFDGRIQMTRNSSADDSKAPQAETRASASASKAQPAETRPAAHAAGKPPPAERAEARAAAAAKAKASPKKPAGAGGMNDASVDDLLE
jgi:cytoskeletal protein CcmA (bactofilin family)